MKITYLVFIMLLTNLYSSEYANKINEYCTIKASVYTSERLYKHEYTHCSKTLLNKKLSINEIKKMIKNEPTKEKREAKNQRYKNSTKHLLKKMEQQEKKKPQFTEPSRKFSDSSTSFDSYNESCYNLGMAFGACSIRSMHNMACEVGTDFVMPRRCRGKSTTQQGINDGALFQKLLIQKGVYR